MLWQSALLFLFLQNLPTPSHEIQPPSDQQVDETVMQLQGGSKYQEHFDRMPYVKDGSVFIFPGENFGVNVSVEGEKITTIGYSKDSKKADVRLKFTEEGSRSRVMMMLVIQSNLKRTLYLDAAMQLPNRKGTYKTSILPVLAGKSGFESWPQPITLLELRNLRFTEKPPAS